MKSKLLPCLALALSVAVKTKAETLKAEMKLGGGRESKC
jgi:hypothetical protein